MENDQIKLPYFKIDGQSYVIQEKKTKWVIGELSKTLYTEISIHSQDVESDKKKGLLGDYSSNGEISFNFEASKIYKDGIPTGICSYSEDKNPDDYTYFRKDGLDYLLYFFGTIEYKGGWVLIEGELKNRYGEDSPKFPIKAALEFNPASLDWNNYKFRSLVETKGSDPHIIRLLEITNPTFSSLPETIYSFENLEYLIIQRIGNYGDKDKSPFADFGERIAELKNLKQITVNQATISSLPKSFANLIQLDRLSIIDCELGNLPDGIWKMPKLEYVLLGKNKIERIPDQIQMPSLVYLDIENNLLKTLPESLLQQPNLTTIKASLNPLEALPFAYNSFNGLGLNMKEKKRLLDTAYPGADGKGAVKWDESMYLGENDQLLISPVEKIIDTNELSEYKEELISLIKRSVGFILTTEEDYAAVGNHRFGGKPDLPESIPYPTFFSDYRNQEFNYEFIAQINCEEIAEIQDYLPRTGSLFFFFKSFQFFGSEDQDIGKIIYVEDNKSLASGDRFNFKEEDFYELMDGEYQANKADALLTVSAPSFYASYVNNYLFEGKAESLKDQDDFTYDLYEPFEKPVQELHGVDHAMNAYAFTQHESPELQAALAWKGDPQDWVILLLVSSKGNFQWGDAGELFFVIHKSDLAKRDFSKVFVTMESS